MFDFNETSTTQPIYSSKVSSLKNELNVQQQQIKVRQMQNQLTFSQYKSQEKRISELLSSYHKYEEEHHLADDSSQPQENDISQDYHSLCDLFR